MCGVCREPNFGIIQWLMVFIHMDKQFSQNHFLNRPSFFSFICKVITSQVTTILHRFAFKLFYM